MRIGKYLTAGVVAAVLTGCSDPEKDANLIFVDAANEIQSAVDLDTLAKYKAYVSAKSKLDALNSDVLKGTQASLKVASQEKIGGLTSAELNVALATLKASNAVCGTVRTADCVSGIVTAAVQDLIDRRDNTALKSITRLVGRLELAGKSAEATAIIEQLGKAIGSPNIVNEAKAEYPRLLGETLAEFPYSYSDYEMVTLYKMALPFVNKNSPNASGKQLNDQLLRTINLIDMPNLYLFLVENEKDQKHQEYLADRALGSTSLRLGSKPSLELSLKLTEYLATDKRVERLAQIASIDKAAANKVFEIIVDPVERKAVEDKLFSLALWDWPAEDRLEVLKRTSPETLKAYPHVVISIAYANKDRRSELQPAFDAIGSVPASEKKVMLLYPAVKAYLEGTGGAAGLVSQIAQKVSDTTSDDRYKLCELAPGFLAQTGNSALLPSLADACMPIYRLSGDSEALAASQVRDLASAAQYAKEEDLSTALAKVKDLQSMQTDPQGIVYTLLWGGKTQLALDVARNVRPKGELSLSPIYSQLLRKAISTDGTDPQVVWADIKSRNVKFEHGWIVPAEKLTKTGAEFLDKLIAEEPDLVARQIVDVNARWQSPSSNGFALLSKERLTALTKNIMDPVLKAEALDALAMTVRKDDAAELLDTVWNLQDDKVGAALRITAIQLGVALDNTTTQTE